jgi:cytidine deaminase
VAFSSSHLKWAQVTIHCSACKELLSDFHTSKTQELMYFENVNPWEVFLEVINTMVRLEIWVKCTY